jgi:periplasmic protein CpxP/Spy
LPYDFQKIDYLIMKKETFYKVTIAVLIVLNLLQVGGRFLAQRPKGNPVNMAVKHLGLDDEQEKQFRELAQVHRKKMIDFRTRQASLTETYFNQPSDTLLNEVIFIERKKIEVTFQHFNDVKKMLKENQLDEFEGFKKRSIKRILGFPAPNNPRQNTP